MRWALDDYIAMGRGARAAAKLAIRLGFWLLVWGLLAYAVLQAVFRT